MRTRCLTTARMNMRATLLTQVDDYNPDPIDPTDYGEWVNSQDPLTGEIVRVWKPYEDQPDPDGPGPGKPTYKEINCIARGIVDGGIRVAGTTEWFGNQNYESIDFVKMWVPPGILVTKRDRITNIKDATGRIRWRNEEFEPRNPDNPIDLNDPETYNNYLRATVFNVNGVTPLFDAYNRMTEQFVLLENAEVSEDINA